VNCYLQLVAKLHNIVQQNNSNNICEVHNDDTRSAGIRD